MIRNASTVHIVFSGVSSPSQQFYKAFLLSVKGASCSKKYIL